jgi:hypothetical protein
LTPFRATLRDIFIDSFEQMWITVVNKQNLKERLGVMVLDTNGTPTDQSDDACQFFSTQDQRGIGLPNPGVNAVAESKDGFIWVATDQGMAYMINTGVVASDPGAVFNWPLYADRTTGTYLLQGVQINDIAVDPANRIWVATATGVWLIAQAEGGYQEVRHFSPDNSPLLANEVLSVEVNPVTGEVYFATVQGLISYQGDAVRPSEEVRDLFVYPNPVHIQDTGEPTIYIDGLVDQTDIVIMAADGTVVSRFQARGGRAMWDGRDGSQQPVPSGVYLIVAVGQNGEGTAYGKVAILR